MSNRRAAVALVATVVGSLIAASSTVDASASTKRWTSSSTKVSRATAKTSPSPTATATATAAPTATASPTPTVTDTATPVPTATATATAGAPAPTPTPTDTTPAAGFVTRQGTQLMLDGQPYRFAGLNIYNANSTNNCWYSMSSGSTLADSLAATGGIGAFRAWFFQNEATVNGARSWAAFDHTLAVARAAGVKVIPVLVNQWGQCEGWSVYADGYKSESWYQSGYKTLPTSPGMADTYREWVREVVSRYKDDPTILAWQMVNEAEDKVAYGGSCSSTAATSLQSFAGDIAGLIKSIDTNHLVSIGTIGSGQCGSAGSAYKTLHATAGVDLCEYHDYSTVAMPGDQWNGLATRISQCAALGKPVFVGESGVKTADVGLITDRGSLFTQKVQTQMQAGVVGELLWDWRDAAHGGSSTTGYEIGAGDPALAALHL
jgi:hypothetical protein